MEGSGNNHVKLKTSPDKKYLITGSTDGFPRIYPLAESYQTKQTENTFHTITGKHIWVEKGENRKKNAIENSKIGIENRKNGIENKKGDQKSKKGDRKSKKGDRKSKKLDRKTNKNGVENLNKWDLKQ